jgi:hypothetical protein
LDAHAKVLGKRNIVKSRFGEILKYINFEEWFFLKRKYNKLIHKYI